MMLQGNCGHTELTPHVSQVAAAQLGSKSAGAIVGKLQVALSNLVPVFLTSL